jgi:hypothetical protein
MKADVAEDYTSASDDDGMPTTRAGWLRNGFVEIPGFPDYLYRPSYDADFEPEVVSFKRTASGRRLKSVLVGDTGKGYSLWRDSLHDDSGMHSASVEFTFAQLHDLCFPGGLHTLYVVAEIVPPDIEDEGSCGLPGLAIVAGRSPYHFSRTIEQARRNCEEAAKQKPGSRFGYFKVQILETCVIEGVRWERPADVPF